MNSKPKKYANARAFREALEARLKAHADKTGSALQRVRRQVAFDRFLARLFASKPLPWVLKGGYSMELRFDTARATKDIDLALVESKLVAGLSEEQRNETLRNLLEERAALELGDHFEFLLGESMLELEAAPYGGARYPVDARMDGRSFVKFHIDLGLGDVPAEDPDVLTAHDWLAFAEIEAPKILALSREQQFAEKIHAYTLPRSGPNSRVKDLVDLCLLIRDDFDTTKIRLLLVKTFKRRGTHDLPARLETPPPAWRTPFAALADEVGLKLGIQNAFEMISAAYDSVYRE